MLQAGIIAGWTAARITVCQSRGLQQSMHRHWQTKRPLLNRCCTTK